MSATKVTLRKRELPSGKITLYLDFYPAIRNPRTMALSRREYLGIYLVKNPKTPLERKTNAEKLKQAEAIRALREIAIINEQFGFIDKGRMKMDFLAYFEKITMSHAGSYKRTFLHFKDFCHGRCTFGELTVDFCRKFMDYLQTSKSKNAGDKTLGQNTQADYWMCFRSVLKQAYKDRLLPENLNDHLTQMDTVEVHKEFLTLEEVRTLYKTPCKNDIAKRASLFSCLTGLRISDIMALKWENVRQYPDGGRCISIRTQKTKADALLPISEEAYKLLGKPGTGNVFAGISEWQLRRALPDWLKAAGITRHITFHSFRHTNATILANLGIPIYTVSAMLTHKNVKTTQVYASLVDDSKRKAANAIVLDPTKEVSKDTD